MRKKKSPKNNIAKAKENVRKAVLDKFSINWSINWVLNNKQLISKTFELIISIDLEAEFSDF